MSVAAFSRGFQDERVGRKGMNCARSTYAPSPLCSQIESRWMPSGVYGQLDLIWVVGIEL